MGAVLPGPQEKRFLPLDCVEGPYEAMGSVSPEGCQEGLLHLVQKWGSSSKQQCTKHHLDLGTREERSVVRETGGLTGPLRMSTEQSWCKPQLCWLQGQTLHMCSHHASPAMLYFLSKKIHRVLLDTHWTW
jgi:hypothetical protein